MKVPRRVNEQRKSAGWLCLNAAAALLAPLEREVVLGDLVETDRGIWSGLSDVFGLAARRQLELWAGWRPWAASVGLALPASLFLMGSSVAASGAMARLLREPKQAGMIWVPVSSLLLVMCWAWMTGFVVGSISRATLWASALASSTPCLHCLLLWPGHGLSAFRLLIFVLPGLWGVWRGRRNSVLAPRMAVFLAAAAVFAPLMWSKGGWIYGCSLLWPGCYLTATAMRQKT